MCVCVCVCVYKEIITGLQRRNKVGNFYLESDHLLLLTVRKRSVIVTSFSCQLAYVLCHLSMLLIKSHEMEAASH